MFFITLKYFSTYIKVNNVLTQYMWQPTLYNTILHYLCNVSFSLCSTLKESCVYMSTPLPCMSKSTHNVLLRVNMSLKLQSR